jgi:uncharacterized protein YjiS (DUF1127 family)
MEIAMSKASTGSSAARPSGFALAANMLRTLSRHLRAGRNARHVTRFNDYMLRDIGLTRADIISAAHGKVLRRD